ncbi:hypothetical protein DRQ50_13000 [bacterium]|nr:MAG: hypothetical protein DRQ50_13000 [bacterium]
MRPFALFFLLAIICSCTPSPSDTDATANYEHLVAGLIEFKSPAGMFEPDSVQCANPHTLTERMEFYNTPGVSMAVVGNGGVAWTGVYGTLDVDTGVRVTAGTIFQAASTSKLVTAVLALYFVQQGDLDLDADVNDYLTSWQIEANEFTARQTVTLRMLLTHRAGMPSTNFDHQEDAPYPTLLDVLNGRSPALNEPATPELEPGTQWQYSNVAYDVIQLLLEDVTGRSFTRLADEVVFAHLGMKNSSFAYPLAPELQKHEAMPHDAEGISREPAMHLTALAHGGMTTTPGDLALLVDDLLLAYGGDAQRILTPQTARQLFGKECELDPRMFGIPLSEGLGVLLMGEGDDRVFALPGSNLPGLNCWLMGWPEKGRGIVVMTNGARGELLAMEVITAFVVLESDSGCGGSTPSE